MSHLFHVNPPLTLTYKSSIFDHDIQTAQFLLLCPHLLIYGYPPTNTHQTLTGESALVKVHSCYEAFELESVTSRNNKD